WKSSPAGRRSSRRRRIHPSIAGACWPAISWRHGAVATWLLLRATIRNHCGENSKMFLRMFTLALSLCALAPPASAADYPDHAIKMIVPFAAGGGTDLLARIIAQNLNNTSRQPVVMENQPGASGAIGTRAA